MSRCIECQFLFTPDKDETLCSKCINKKLNIEVFENDNDYESELAQIFRAEEPNVIINYIEEYLLWDNDFISEYDCSRSD